MTTQVVVAELETLKASINSEAKKAEEHASKAVQHAINAGRMLVRVKKMLPHGEFTPWVAENTTLSTRNAQRYMRAFDRYEEGLVELTDDVTVEKLTAEPRTKTAAAAHLPPPPDPRIAELEAELAAAAKLKEELATAQRAKNIAESQAKSAKQALAEAELDKQRAVEDALAKVPKPQPAPAKTIDPNPELARRAKELDEKYKASMESIKELMLEVATLREENAKSKREEVKERPRQVESPRAVLLHAFSALLNLNSRVALKSIKAMFSTLYHSDTAKLSKDDGLMSSINQAITTLQGECHE